MDLIEEPNCTFNNVAEECKKASSYNDSALGVTSIVIQVIFIVIIGFTNGSMLYLFCRCQQLRNITNCLIMNLVICNLIMLPVHGLDLIIHMKPEISRGYICLLLCGVIYLVAVVSCLILLAISVDKVVKIFRPLKYEVFITWLRVEICIFTIWGSVVFVTILIPFAGLHQLDSLTALQSSPCEIYGFVQVFSANYPVLINVIFGVVPFIALCTIYARILTFLIPRIRSPKQTIQSELLRQEVKPVVTILVMVLTTGLAYLPISVVTMLTAYDSRFIVSPALHHALSWLNYLNLAVNPSVYCLRSSAFQTAWKRYICRCLLPSRDVKNSFTVFNNILLPIVISKRRRSSIFPDSIELTVDAPGDQ